MRSDKYNKGSSFGGREERDVPSRSGGRELTPEQRRYLEIVEEERSRERRGDTASSRPSGKRKRKRERSAVTAGPSYNGYYGGQKKKKHGRIRTAIICILIIAICVTGLAGGYFYHLAGNLDIIPTNDSEFQVDSGVSKDLDDYRCIAILGSDARKGQGYDRSRTDAIIIARIAKKTGEIQLISVMRDSYLELDGLDGEPSLDKITHAHAFGGGVNTCKALNRSLDLNINEYVIFNWTAVKDLVDALGGIEVNIKANELRDLNYYGYDTLETVGGSFTPIAKAGRQTIDGVTAATYCRIRKHSGGDSARGGRMKTVMTAIMKKARRTNPVKLNRIAEKVFPEIRTNMSKGTILKSVAGLIRYDFGKSDGWPEDYYVAKINGRWYAVPRTLESEVINLHKKAFGESDYQLSGTAKDISDRIIQSTGVY